MNVFLGGAISSLMICQSSVRLGRPGKLCVQNPDGYIFEVDEIYEFLPEAIFSNNFAGGTHLEL